MYVYLYVCVYIYRTAMYRYTHIYIGHLRWCPQLPLLQYADTHIVVQYVDTYIVVQYADTHIVVQYVDTYTVVQYADTHTACLLFFFPLTCAAAAAAAACCCAALFCRLGCCCCCSPPAAASAAAAALAFFLRSCGRKRRRQRATPSIRQHTSAPWRRQRAKPRRFRTQFTYFTGTKSTNTDTSWCFFALSCLSFALMSSIRQHTSAYVSITPPHLSWP